MRQCRWPQQASGHGRAAQHASNSVIRRRTLRIYRQTLAQSHPASAAASVPPAAAQAPAAAGATAGPTAPAAADVSAAAADPAAASLAAGATAAEPPPLPQGPSAAADAHAPKVPLVRLDPETKAQHRRPVGWVAPGPPPAGPGSDPTLVPGRGETLSFLTGDWRIFQLKDGHRWSLDDMVTAMVALQEASATPSAAAPPTPSAATQPTPPAAASAAAPPTPSAPTHPTPPAAAPSASSAVTQPTPPAAPWVVRHHLDLGCGIGSVLLMVAWGLPGVASDGVEAQEVSLQLACRSIRYNGVEDRVQVQQGDIRTAVQPREQYDLITGTPPYIPIGAGARSGRPQKAPCCLETRGGIEDYAAAAASWLAPEGRFVVCMGVQGQPRPDRGFVAAAAAGLRVVRVVEVLPKQGKPALMHVYVMARDGADNLQAPRHDLDRANAAQPHHQQQHEQIQAGQQQYGVAHHPQQQQQPAESAAWHQQQQQQDKQQTGDTPLSQPLPVCINSLPSAEWQVDSSSRTLSSSCSGSGTSTAGRGGSLVKEVFTVRAADDRLTPQMQAARAYMGLPP